MATAGIETHHPDMTSPTGGADNASAASAEAHEPNWWWDYAAMKAPDHNEMYYLKFSLLSIALFFALHFTLHYLFRNNQVYQNSDTKKKAYYRATVVSIIHSLIVLVLCTIAMMYICPNG